MRNVLYLFMLSLFFACTHKSLFLNLLSANSNKWFNCSIRRLYVLSVFMVFLITNANGQGPSVKWSLILNGQKSVFLSDLVTDKNGNTYIAVNYTSNLKIPGLDKEVPFTAHAHIHGLVMKINSQGKPIWAHPFFSGWDNRINDLALAPNGDLLITGFGDGILHFPGLKDTLKVGIAPIRNHLTTTRFQGLFAARYSSDGERKWVQYWNSPVAEGVAIAANKQNEVSLVYNFRVKISHQGKIIDEYPISAKIESRTGLATFDAKGNLKKIHTLASEKSGMAVVNHKLIFDNADNLLLYGLFRGKIHLTPTDSLVNDNYYESSDSYLAKFDPEGKIIWAKKIGGQNSQNITDVVIGPDNSIYGVGYYATECVFGDAVSVIHKSRYELKSYGSLFYFNLCQNGELEYIRYVENKGSASYIRGQSIGLDQNGKIHIVGDFNDTIRIDKGVAATWHHNSNGFFSYWNKNKLTSLQKVGDSPKGWLTTNRIAVNKNTFTCAGEYAGEFASLDLQGRKLSLSNNDYSRDCYIFGGTIPAEKTNQSNVAKCDTVRKERMEMLKPLLTCLSQEDNTITNIWYQDPEGKPGTVSGLVKTPCGEPVTGMEVALYPNPTKGEIKVMVTGIKGITQFEIYSVTGQLVLSHRVEIEKQEQIMIFDLTRLSAATYILRVTHKNYQKALKIVKVN